MNAQERIDAKLKQIAATDIGTYPQNFWIDAEGTVIDIANKDHGDYIVKNRPEFVKDESDYTAWVEEGSTYRVADIMFGHGWVRGLLHSAGLQFSPSISASAFAEVQNIIKDQFVIGDRMFIDINGVGSFRLPVGDKMALRELNQALNSMGTTASLEVDAAKIDNLITNLPEDQQQILALNNQMTVENKAKYAQFLVTNYEAPDVVELIAQFDNRLPKLKQKDIYSYSIEELRDTLQATPELKTKQEIIGEGTEELQNNEDLEVHEVTTKEAAMKLGTNTRWCISTTSDDNMFNYYYQDHNIYIIFDKRDGGLVKYAVIVNVDNEETLYDSEDNALFAQDEETLYDGAANELFAQEYFATDGTLEEVYGFAPPSEADLDERAPIIRENMLSKLTESHEGVYDSNGDVVITRALVTGGKLNVVFGIVEGTFYCQGLGLTSLEGAPYEVGGNFHCEDNNLTTLEGAPEDVYGNFNCRSNKLTSLEGAPNIVRGTFDCSYNELTSLAGISPHIDYMVSVQHNPGKFTNEDIDKAMEDSKQGDDDDFMVGGSLEVDAAKSVTKSNNNIKGDLMGTQKKADYAEIEVSRKTYYHDEKGGAEERLSSKLETVANGDMMQYFSDNPDKLEEYNERQDAKKAGTTIAVIGDAGAGIALTRLAEKMARIQTATLVGAPLKKEAGILDNYDGVEEDGVFLVTYTLSDSAEDVATKTEEVRQRLEDGETVSLTIVGNDNGNVFTVTSNNLEDFNDQLDIFQEMYETREALEENPEEDANCMEIEEDDLTELPDKTAMGLDYNRLATASKKTYADKWQEKLKEFQNEVDRDDHNEITNTHIDQDAAEAVEDHYDQTAENEITNLEEGTLINTAPVKSYDIKRIDGTEDTIEMHDIPQNIPQQSEMQEMVTDFYPTHNNEKIGEDPANPPVYEAEDVPRNNSENPDGEHLEIVPDSGAVTMRDTVPDPSASDTTHHGSKKVAMVPPAPAVNADQTPAGTDLPPVMQAVLTQLSPVQDINFIASDKGEKDFQVVLESGAEIMLSLSPNDDILLWDLEGSTIIGDAKNTQSVIDNLIIALETRSDEVAASKVKNSGVNSRGNIVPIRQALADFDPAELLFGNDNAGSGTAAFNSASIHKKAAPPHPTLDQFPEDFQEWFNDGNVMESVEDVYSTQDAQYNNEIKGMNALYRYYLKEFVLVNGELDNAASFDVEAWKPNSPNDIRQLTGEEVKAEISEYEFMMFAQMEIGEEQVFNDHMYKRIS